MSQPLRSTAHPSSLPFRPQIKQVLHASAMYDLILILHSLLLRQQRWRIQFQALQTLQPATGLPKEICMAIAMTTNTLLIYKSLLRLLVRLLSIYRIVVCGHSRDLKSPSPRYKHKTPPVFDCNLQMLNLFLGK